jgi:cytochrome bd ubiquinol oxidase subunit II
VAPRTIKAVMFWGAGLFVVPLMLIYTAISVLVFRGRVGKIASDSKPY